MGISLTSEYAKARPSNDVNFLRSKMATDAIAIHGKEKVVNGTIGAIHDDDGELVFLKTVEEAFLNLPRNEYAAYAPVPGLPAYLEKVVDECFGQSKPAGYIKAIATPGGTGVVHHLIHNYTEIGDEVLTSDWRWAIYDILSEDNRRRLRTFELFTDALTFNREAFGAAVKDVAGTQRNVVVILNSPAHNPTGFSLTDEDWDAVLSILSDIAENGRNNVILEVDAAYLDYAGPKEETRRFFGKFSNLPERLLVIIGYSMSKAYTVYGQRMGAMIAVSSNEDVIREFENVNARTSRATWSNTSRPTMMTMVALASSSEKQAAYEAERNSYYELIKRRAEIFVREAESCGLPMLPYCAGFFIALPCDDPTALCDALAEELVFLVPLEKGVRIAICGIPTAQVEGLAVRISDAAKRIANGNE